MGEGQGGSACLSVCLSLSLSLSVRFGLGGGVLSFLPVWENIEDFEHVGEIEMLRIGL